MKFAPSIKGIIREGKSNAILLTLVDRHGHLLSGHCETSQVMKKCTFRWTEHVSFLGITISVPHKQLSPACKAVISRLDVNHIFSLKTRNAPLPEVQRFDF